MERKYYWLKLPTDFFSDKCIKKLRSIAGGDTYTVIYLKMLLAALKDEGRLVMDGIEDTVAEEIALEIDEDPDNVAVTLQFLYKAGLIREMEDQGAVFMEQVPEMIGSETEAARRMRRVRSKRVDQICDKSEQERTECEQCSEMFTEIDIEKDIEKRREEREGDSDARTREAISEYVKSEHLCIKPDYFFDYYEARGWINGCGQEIKDWKSMARTWHVNERSRSSPKGNKPAFDNFNQRDYDFEALERRIRDKHNGI